MMKIQITRNFKLAYDLIMASRMKIGTWHGKTFLQTGATLYPQGNSFIEFRPRPKGHIVESMDPSTGKVSAYAIYETFDMKSMLWALRKFCGGRLK